MKNITDNDKRSSINHVAAAHIWLAFLLAVQVVIYDAWELITPEAVVWRWLIAVGLFAVAAVVWYLSRVRSYGTEKLIMWLIATDMLVASFSVYTQRGMAARAVALYAVPIVISSLLGKSGVIFGTAAVSVVAYIITTASYFILNFNEGYKIELYGEVSFYSVLFLILAVLVWAVTRPKK